MTVKHYRYGGSNAARQIHCPGWRKLADDVIPVGRESEYAREGTALHKCMDMILNGDVEDINMLRGEIIEGVLITDEHVERMLMALQAFEQLEEDYFPDSEGTDYLVESTLEINEHIGGTADVIVWDKNRIAIVDWKFGQGVEVEAENSAQGMFYAMCGEHELPDTFQGRGLIIVIIQPMPSRDTETMKIWEVPSKTYHEFKRSYMASLDRTELKTGKHCQFCPCAPLCPKKSGEAHKAVLLDPKNTDKLNDNLKLAHELKQWCEDVIKFGHEQLEEGLVLPDWKLVPKRAIRKWTDEAEAEALAKKTADKAGVLHKELMVPAKLKTVAQLETVFKKNKLDFSQLGDYIDKTSSGTTLAPADDPREGMPSAGGLAAALDRLDT